MDNTVKNILEFFSDKQKSITAKLSIALISLFLIVATDYFGQFTYNYQLNNKIDQLTKIQDLKITFKKNSNYLNKLQSIENDLLFKQHYSEKLTYNLNRTITIHDTICIVDTIYLTKDTLGSTSDSLKKPKGKPSSKQQASNLFKYEKPLERWWMMFSSNYLLFLLIPFLILAPFFDNTKWTISKFLGVIASGLIYWGIIELITWLSFQIPRIGNEPYYNYITNAFLHITIFGIIFLSFKKSK